MTVKSTTVWNVEQSEYLMSTRSAKSVIMVGHSVNIVHHGIGKDDNDEGYNDHGGLLK